MELTGTFESFPLSELLEMMQHSSMCGVLEIQGRHGAGYVWTRDGVICQAQYAGEQGRTAIGRMFEEGKAAFTVRADGAHPWGPPGLGDAATLIAEGKQLARLWYQIRRRIPDLGLVPVVRSRSFNRQDLSDLDMVVLTAIDGQHTIRDLTEPTVLELIDICRSLIRLIDAGVVELTQRGGLSQPVSPHVPGPLPESAPPFAPAPSPPTGGGLFKRPLGQDGGESSSKSGLLSRLQQQALRQG